MALLGGVLRAAVQLPRDPLLRHQGRVHRPDLEGDDRARRQDPHSAQRRRRRQATGQIEEFLMKFNGEGIQHIALSATICSPRVDRLRAARRAADDARRRRPITRCSTSACPAMAEAGGELQTRGILLDGSDRGRRAAPAAADLLRDPARPGVLRVHPAQGRRRLWRGQLQGAVRVDRARPGARAA